MNQPTTLEWHSPESALPNYEEEVLCVCLGDTTQTLPPIWYEVGRMLNTDKKGHHWFSLINEERELTVILWAKLPEITDKYRAQFKDCKK